MKPNENVTPAPVGSGRMVSPTSLTAKQVLAYAKKTGIECEEIYDPSAPAHWPKDRCYRYETDEEFVKRVRALMANDEGQTAAESGSRKETK